MNRIFKTSEAFRKSLEQKIKQTAQKKSIDLQRIRRKLAFDRLLARLFFKKPQFFLKGGYAMEVNFNKARVTKDIDLVC